MISWRYSFIVTKVVTIDIVQGHPEILLLQRWFNEPLCLEVSGRLNVHSVRTVSPFLFKISPACVQIKGHMSEGHASIQHSGIPLLERPLIRTAIKVSVPWMFPDHGVKTLLLLTRMWQACNTFGLTMKFNRSVSPHPKDNEDWRQVKRRSNFSQGLVVQLVVGYCYWSFST